uniref:Uncharacterized protein n=1 Tax=Glossina austeni TaxID=7395 RepID=A0A1A9UUH7_GLOAU
MACSRRTATKTMLCDLSVCNCQKCRRRRNEPEPWRSKGKRLATLTNKAAKKLALLARKSPFGSAEQEDEIKCTDLTHVLFDVIGAISKTKVIVLSAIAVVASAIFAHYALVSLSHLKSRLQKKPSPSPIKAETPKTRSRSAQPAQPTQSAAKSIAKSPTEKSPAEKSQPGKKSPAEKSKPAQAAPSQPAKPPESKSISADVSAAAKAPGKSKKCKRKETSPPTFLYLPKPESVVKRPAGLFRRKPPTVVASTCKSDRNRLCGGLCRTNCPPAKDGRKYKFCSLLDTCDKRKFGGEERGVNTEDRATNTPMSDEEGRAIFQTYRTYSYPMEMKSPPGAIVYLYNCIFRRICPGPDTSPDD